MISNVHLAQSFSPWSIGFSALGSVVRQHIMVDHGAYLMVAGKHGERGRERLSFHSPLQEHMLNDIRSLLGSTSYRFLPPSNNTKLRTNPCNTWAFRQHLRPKLKQLPNGDFLILSFFLWLLARMWWKNGICSLSPSFSISFPFLPPSFPSFVINFIFLF
jgi:hypothetical protein